MRIIGIDPGLSGACFFYDTETHNFCARRFISVDGRLDVKKFNEFIQTYSPDQIFIEKIFLTGREGGQSAMTIGANYGRILATLELLALPYIEVTPKVWQRALRLTGGSRAIVKEQAKILAVKRFTLMPFLFGKSKKPHDGCTDAACITMYGDLVARGELCQPSDTKKKLTRNTRSFAQSLGTLVKSSNTSKSKKPKQKNTSRSKKKQ